MKVISLRCWFLIKIKGVFGTAVPDHAVYGMMGTVTTNPWHRNIDKLVETGESGLSAYPKTNMEVSSRTAQNKLWSEPFRLLYDPG